MTFPTNNSTSVVEPPGDDPTFLWRWICVILKKCEGECGGSWGDFFVMSVMVPWKRTACSCGGRCQSITDDVLVTREAFEATSRRRRDRWQVRAREARRRWPRRNQLSYWALAGA